MKKEVSPGVIIGVIAATLVVAGFVIFRAIAGDVSSSPSEMGQQLSKIMARTGGDVSKMTPEEQKIYDKAVETGYYRPSGDSGAMSSTGRPSAPSYNRNSGSMGSSSGGPSGGYPGSSGGYPGSSGRYPGASAPR